MRKIFTLALATAGCLAVSAQNITLKGVLENNRYDDGDQLKSEWIGSLYDENGNYTGKTAFIVDQGIYSMTWDGTAVSTPVKSPAVNMADIKQGTKVNYDKALWATNFNMMIGNSGAVYTDGWITTVFSRDYQSTEDSELFAVRRWDSSTGNLLSAPNAYYPVSANLESAGMSYNPADGKVYGLFHFTDVQLDPSITNDPNYSVDQDDSDWNREGVDDGYAIGVIDLKTMTVKRITPGLYYENFVTFAINSEGRAFALTSGGSNGAVNEDGKIYNIDNVLTGAQLYEFNLQTGMKIGSFVMKIDEETSEMYQEFQNKYTHGTGYASQFRRQSACFAKSNPNKMYWVGYFNSGKGINDYGSWSTLSDKDWRTNGKYDTALYEVDVTTGDATRLAKIPNRCMFSCIWVDGDDVSDGSGFVAAGIENVKAQTTAATRVYNLAGQLTNAQGRGLHIVKSGDKVRKVLTK